MSVVILSQTTAIEFLLESQLSLVAVLGAGGIEPKSKMNSLLKWEYLWTFISTFYAQYFIL